MVMTILCKCSNSECGAEYDIDQLEPLLDGEGLEYMTGGSIVPCGWCPSCGHSAHEINDHWDRLQASHEQLLAALQGLFANCVMIHKHWGENSNSKEATDAIEAASAAIETAKEFE